MVAPSTFITAFLWVLAIALAILQADLFFFGYRLSVDDIGFHANMFGDPLGNFNLIKTTAVFQGRIGQFISVPLGIIGAYYSDFIFFRILSVGGYFLIFLLLSKFIENITKEKIGLLLFVLYSSLSALGYNNAPPNAYPILITAPFLLILIILLGSHFLESRNLPLSKSQSILLFLPLTFAMLINEYAFIFGSCLITCDFLARISMYEHSSGSFIDSFKRLVKVSYFRVSALAIITSFLIYICFRVAFPSQYSGNQPDGLFNFPLVLQAIVAHILFGISIAPQMSFQGEMLTNTALKNLPSIPIGVASLLGLMTSGLIAYLMGSIGSIRRPWVIGFFGLLLSIFVSLPTAITLKTQENMQWCSFISGGPGCSYIDSRISYYGFMAAVAMLPFCLFCFFKSRRIRRGIILIYALLIGVGVFYGYLNNWQVAQHMKKSVSPWERATLLTCISESDFKISSKDLINLIDPEGVIQYHPDFPSSPYWRAYINNRRGSIVCSKLSEHQLKFIVKARYLGGSSINRIEIDFFEPDSRRFLSEGWSDTESWGVWSDGYYPKLKIIWNGRRDVDLVLKLEGRPLLAKLQPTQNITVLANGKPIGRLDYDLYKDPGGIRKLIIPKAYINSADPLLIEFNFDQLHTPAELKLSEDKRLLGFGLTSVEIYSADQ
ncbi:hypothetical protein [Polynucleobacter asymbioticus]|jgi:hypothetical protein|uniref:Uncharacterized protein n=1 Tax=Polynucleobacter asymbioticus TaxID=576611 RepID=A0AAC9ITI8_9BURK|nr:hypothetical protein [Polynucleobacter asymbioticus]APB98382.1 hypothetical protein A4F89_03020 [Polynucleobacter asymbioticus]APC00667.1 hypothetical protein AOC25_03020 [Polynucleobacter asymbioticus]